MNAALELAPRLALERLRGTRGGAALDLLAVAATGAYCAPLSSNYNHVPRPPIVAVHDGASRVIVRGESMADLLARDTGIAR